ncbi:hypothetical protein SM0020_29465 [Sinorhizobium meliloti CCNWSX0020]|uniref:Uncharacterized protein n=1 Tax=Sinorhizobium meliloti CCNWSX0020 TaxID=1107881 RepID=H0G8Q2_RHIML|nr:hypothetical protein SM0020_29465 [Sinorhizobium meliloti CCNWSX0020]
MQSLLFLISVLVTEIQQRRVCGAGRLFQPKDLVWLDPCDEHRDEGIKQAAPGIPNLNRP